MVGSGCHGEQTWVFKEDYTLCCCDMLSLWGPWSSTHFSPCQKNLSRSNESTLVLSWETEWQTNSICQRNIFFLLLFVCEGVNSARVFYDMWPCKETGLITELPATWAKWSTKLSYEMFLEFSNILGCSLKYIFWQSYKINSGIWWKEKKKKNQEVNKAQALMFANLVQ